MLESFPPRHRHCLLTPDLVMWVKQMINHPPQTPKIGGMNRSQMGGLYIDVYGIVLPTFVCLFFLGSKWEDQMEHSAA